MNCACIAVGVLAFVSISCVAAHDAMPPDTRQARLEARVNALAATIGERNTRKPDALRAAETWVTEQFEKTGLTVKRETYQADDQTVANLSIDLEGTAEAGRWIVVGAHYDTAPGTPGANDNGSGVAALLELANALSRTPLEKSVRFVAFVNEEPPYFQTPLMGSVVNAENAKKRNETIDAMIAIETIGCFSDVEGSQRFPDARLAARFPKTGNFIGIVSGTESATLAKQVHHVFQRNAKLPAELAILPTNLPGVSWSDHWSFWQSGYRAIMVTDTAPFRYNDYHKPTDTPDKIDFARMSLVVDGLERAIIELATASATSKPSTP